MRNNAITTLSFAFAYCSISSTLQAATFSIFSTFSLPQLGGPISISEGSPLSITFDSSSVPTGTQISAATLSVDWADGGGLAWSSDARATFGGLEFAPSSGAFDNGSSTTLQWDVNFPATSTSSSFEVIFDQSTQRGSTGFFSNFNLTLDNAPPGQLAGSLPESSQSSVAYSGLVWYQFSHRGGLFDLNTNGSTFDTEIGLFDFSGALIESDDDGGTGLDSSITRELDPGDYFIAFSQFNTSFSNGFTVTGNTDSGAGTLIINVVVPEPTSSLLLATSGFLLCIRRRK